MAERVDLPADPWLDTELAQDKVVPFHHVGEHVSVSRASLVVHRPAGVDHLQLPVRDEGANTVLHRFGLQIPPHLEELDLDLHEATLRVREKRGHDRAEFDLNICALDIVSSSIEVLVDRLQPADIVVRVRADVHRDPLSDYQGKK